jgi:Na+/H+-dicarboxylate symporter
MKSHNKVLIGLVSGVIAGIIGNRFATPHVLQVFAWMSVYGRIFIRLISMIVIPLVVASMIVGIASLGDLRTLGRIGGKTLVTFFLTTVIAAAIGAAVSVVIHPGAGLMASGNGFMASPTSGPPPVAPPAVTMPDALVDIIPANPFAAASGGDLFGIIVFTMIFGAAIGSLPNELRTTLVKVFQAINEACMKVIHWTMMLAPTAVFCLVASVLARFGVQLLRGLAMFCVTVIAGLLIQLVVTYGLILVVGCRRNRCSFIVRFLKWRSWRFRHRHLLQRCR